MEKLYRQIYGTFWSDPAIVDSFSPEDKFFYLYLMTNEYTRQCGIYQISLKQISFDTGYSPEAVKTLVDRFQNHLKRIVYNPETREIAILNWAKYNYPEKLQDNRFACIREELQQIKDQTLVKMVLSHANDEVRIALLGKAPTDNPSQPPQSPSEAPFKPLGEEEEKEEEKEKEERDARDEKNEPESETMAPHFKIASHWFDRYVKLTCRTMMPDERSNLSAKKLLELVGGNLQLALDAVDFYFDNWQSLWFACARGSKGIPPVDRKWAFSFQSFCSNIQEIISAMSTQKPKKLEPQTWSTAIIDTGPAPTAEESAAVARQILQNLRGITVS